MRVTINRIILGIFTDSILSSSIFHQQHSVLKIEFSIDDYSQNSSANVDYDIVEASIETGRVHILEGLYAVHRLI